MTKEDVIDLIRDTGFGFLGTTEGDQPRVRPMMPYLTDDNRLLVAMLGRSRTIAQVEANPHVEICFVDRKMWYARITGKAQISEDQAGKQLLWDTIPMLKQYFGGVEDPNFHLMEIEITRVEAMTPHQKEPESVPFDN
ncbi:MAG: pyridoxamine 5'-phosphate oxidase family protein [Candidatus Omnitrophica bacterium]|nr:pyridoxamine 5'-phosphate oxidase family protein [Candidatus Omnitrophota bacterium]MCB9721594.1 pyridoxamine 5'-phosphate oxidase family protein [Candidatus Omnitrophota bacterium]